MSAPKNEPSGLLTIALAGILLFILGSMFWYFFKGPILQVLRWARFAEMAPLVLIHPQFSECLNWLRAAKFNDPQPSAAMMGLTERCFGTAYLQSLPAAEQVKYFSLTGTAMQTIELMIGHYFKWVFVALFAYLGYFIIFVSPRNKFRVKHNLESFIRTQVKMWPVIFADRQFQSDQFLGADTGQHGAGQAAVVRRGAVARGMDRLAPDSGHQQYRRPRSDTGARSCCSWGRAGTAGSAASRRISAHCSPPMR